VQAWVHWQAQDQLERFWRVLLMDSDLVAAAEIMGELLDSLARAASERQLTRDAVPSEIDRASWRTAGTLTPDETVKMIHGDPIPEAWSRIAAGIQRAAHMPAKRAPAPQQASARTAPPRPRPRTRRERHVARKTASADSGDSSSEPPLDPLARLRRVFRRVRLRPRERP
jgi:hypothetical protein